MDFKLKLSAIVISLIAMTSCVQSEDEPTLTANDSQNCTSSISSNTRTIEDAINMANYAATMFDDASTRSVKRFVTLSSAVTPIYKNATRSSDEAPAIYAVDYGDDQGFALISANINQTPILAVTESGSYNEALESNSGFSDFVNLAVTKGDSIPNTQALDFETNGNSGDYKTTTSTSTKASISPKLAVKWGQRYPYGTKCPNGLCGCSVTALSQIMSYYKQPSSLDITYADADISVLHLDWEQIPLHKVTFPKRTTCMTCSAPDSIHTTLAYLCRELGKRIHVIYADSATVASLEGSRYATLLLGYSATNLTYYTANCEETELNNGIMFVGGITENEDSGHIWVIDGYKKINFFVTTSKWDSTLKAWMLYSTDSYDKNYAHINWGADSRSNGYFESGVFDMSKSYSLDNKTFVVDNTMDFSYKVRYFTISH